MFKGSEDNDGGMMNVYPSKESQSKKEDKGGRKDTIVPFPISMSPYEPLTEIQRNLRNHLIDKIDEGREDSYNYIVTNCNFLDDDDYNDFSQYIGRNIQTHLPLVLLWNKSKIKKYIERIENEFGDEYEFKDLYDSDSDEYKKIDDTYDKIGLSDDLQKSFVDGIKNNLEMNFKFSSTFDISNVVEDDTEIDEVLKYSETLKTIKGILNHCFDILYKIGDEYGLIEPKKGFHSKTLKFLKNISEQLSEFQCCMDELYEEDDEGFTN